MKNGYIYRHVDTDHVRDDVRDRVVIGSFLNACIRRVKFVRV